MPISLATLIYRNKIEAYQDPATAPILSILHSSDSWDELAPSLMIKQQINQGRYLNEVYSEERVKASQMRLE